jgi:hypothetical protein
MRGMLLHFEVTLPTSETWKHAPEIQISSEVKKVVFLCVRHLAIYFCDVIMII